MIYVTLTTRNRFWHSALTALSLAQGANKNCFVHVLDDASDDEFADAKRHLFEDLTLRRIVSRYERLPNRVGFCAGRALLVNRFLDETRFSHWFHLDDDILIGKRTVDRALRDYDGTLNRNGLLHIYANPWSKRTEKHGEFSKVEKIGGACFLVHKVVLEQVGNPYAGETDGEKANAAFWRKLRQAGLPMWIRWTNPYECQHTGNVESVIFGHTPSWEHLYARDFKTSQIVEVPPFRTNELRAAIKSRNLSGYVWRMNSACRVQVKLPAPRSKTGVAIRRKG